MPDQSQVSYQDALDSLTAAGAPFELRTEEVGGIPTRNFASRPRSLRELVEGAGKRGDVEFLVQGGQRLSYAEFAQLVWGTAARFREQGLRRGDRIGILAYNSLDFVVSVFAISSIGGITVALNGWWAKEEIDYALRDSGCRFLIVDDRLFPRVSGLLGEIEGLEKTFFAGAGESPTGTVSLREVISSSEQIPSDDIHEDDGFVILYTSGTTGRPKGCVTTHRGTVTQVMGILLHGMLSAALGKPSPLPADGGQPTILMTAPLFHVAGIHTGVCTAMAAGAKIVLNEGRFDPEQVLSLIQRERVTGWSAIPTMLHRVVHCSTIHEYDLSSLSRISFGGAPTAPETMNRAREVFPVEPALSNGYGTTETHGVIMLSGDRELRDKPTCVGHPMPFFDTKLVNEAGEEVADGELGELLLRSPTVTPGYWNRPDATAEAIRDGWLHTGDIAYQDSDGDFHVVDRAKDMIIRGGENVYCVEIESCLADHPDIDEAAVIGVPDTELGERVKAVVVRIPGSGLTEADVQAHVHSRMAAFKVPEFIEFMEKPLPRNPAGKILKEQLRGRGPGAFDPDLIE
ncbi:MAG: long-chain fatty acid--CoA ligase [bacterium]|nr:long-chain fatty acid--CoA ligase [bacterium]